MRDQDCVAFLQWCLPRLGLRWAGFRRVRGTVCKRLARRLRQLGLADLDAYRRVLDHQAAEWAALDALCRIPISRFYRDKALFDALGRSLLPELARQADAAGRQELRCWSAGCASGEEPYSLRLVWDFVVAPLSPHLSCAILATDADAVMLCRARDALYGPGSLKALPPGWRERAFETEDGLFRLREPYRQSTTFAAQDIRSEMPDGPFDLILCRNLVFTYFEPALQAMLFEALDTRLRPGGGLAIGAHEQLPPSATGRYAAAAPGLPLARKAIRQIGGSAA